MRIGGVVAAGLFFASAALARWWPGASLPSAGGPPVPAYAVQDMAAVLSGARRVGSDVAFIQLLQYFGGGDANEAGGKGNAGPRSTWLPRFLPMSRRVAALNPGFHAAVLFAAGSLGFVLDRPDEALSLLEEGTAADPTFWQYRLYAGAVAYRKNQEPDKVIVFLWEALKYPDCPGLLQNILANLLKKRGDFRRAAEVYRHTIQTCRDPYSVDTARRQLERLRKAGLAP